MTERKWDDPHDKFLDALAFVRIGAREGNLNDSEEFATLLEGTDDFDRAQMIAALATLSAILIKEYILPEVEAPEGVAEDELTHHFLNAWTTGVVNAQFEKA